MGRGAGEEAGVIDHDGAAVVEPADAPDLGEEGALGLLAAGVLGDAPVGIEPEEGGLALKNGPEGGELLGGVPEVEFDARVVGKSGLGQLVVLRRQLDRVDEVEVGAGDLDGVTLEGAGLDEEGKAQLAL